MHTCCQSLIRRVNRYSRRSDWAQSATRSLRIQLPGADFIRRAGVMRRGPREANYHDPRPTTHRAAPALTRSHALVSGRACGRACAHSPSRRARDVGSISCVIERPNNCCPAPPLQSSRPPHRRSRYGTAHSGAESAASAILYHPLVRCSAGCTAANTRIQLAIPRRSTESM